MIFQGSVNGAVGVAPPPPPVSLHHNVATPLSSSDHASSVGSPVSSGGHQVYHYPTHHNNNNMMLATAEALAYQNSVSLSANSSTTPVSSSDGANLANGGAVELLQKVVRNCFLFICVNTYVFDMVLS